MPRSERAEQVWTVVEGSAMCLALPVFMLLAVWGINLFEIHATGPIRTILFWAFGVVVALLTVLCFCGRGAVSHHRPDAE